MCSFIGYLLVRFGSVNQIVSLLCGNTLDDTRCTSIQCTVYNEVIGVM